MKVVYTFQIKQDCQKQVKLKLLSLKTRLSAVASVSRLQVQNARWFLSCCVTQFTLDGAAPGESPYSCADGERRRRAAFISRRKELCSGSSSS